MFMDPVDVSGSGIIARLTFEIKSSGTSRLDFESPMGADPITLLDINRILIPCSGVNGLFSNEYQLIPAPVTSFTISKTEAYINEKITFDASASYDLYGKIISYEWEFGDGSSAQGVIVIHSYTHQGIFIVTLRIKNDLGAISHVSKTIKIKAIDTTDISDTGSVKGCGLVGIEMILLLLLLGIFKRRS
jgi:PKD repeat protein